MRNLGMMEMLLIGIAVLLLFGAKRLPEIGSSMGKGIREFKRSISGTDEVLPGSSDSPAQMSDGAGTGAAPSRTSGEPKRLSQ